MNRPSKKRKQPYARKRFGQHFLTDPSIIAQIITGASITPEDHIIEIGPGRGALTRPLVKQGASLTIVELDRDLVAGLKTEFKGSSQVRVVEGDILKTDWNELLDPDKKNKIVANLPYNISSPIFFKLVTHRQKLDSSVIMVQKELAERLQHTGEGKKLKDYGILSVVAGNTFSVNKICNVPASCFSPAPKVNSTVIRLISKKIELEQEDDFFAFVRQAFNNRRKLFTSFLLREHASLYEALPLKDQDFLKGLRPENLLPEQYFRLFSGKTLLD
jgi:16S rRNA (adenine1518-N6/adenine1519-N6)-dimethyltransferase